MNNQEKRKILIVSQYYTPDITAAAYRMNDMVDSVRDMFDVDIITTYPHKSNAAVENCEENIFRVSITSKSSNRVFRYLNEYVGFMLKSIFIYHKLREHYDYVFVTSPPIFTLVSGFVLSRIKKAKLIIDIRDIWPDVLIDDGTLKRSNLIYIVLKKFERFMYRQANHIVCVSKYMKEYIQNLSRKPVSIVYNGVSEQESGFDSEEEGRKHINNKLNLFYTGNIGYFQHLDVLVSCFDTYPQLSEVLQVHIIGGGTELNKLKTLTNKRNAANIKFYGPVKKIETIELIHKNADILFLNLHNSNTLEKTIPSKLFDYLFFNLPIVYGILGEGKEIIEELSCGEFFQWDSEKSLFDALMMVCQNYPNYLDRSKYNKEYVCCKFNRKVMFHDFWRSIDDDQIGIK